MNMRYGVWLKINIISLALVFLAQGYAYAQDGERYGQGGVAPVRGTTPTGPRIAGPNIQGPNIQGPNIQGPNIQGPNIQGPNIQGPNIQGPNIQGPNIQGPNIQGPNIPSPMWSSASQKAEMEKAAAREAAAKEAAAKAAANKQSASGQPAGPQAGFDENGVPSFNPSPIQTFPQGPTQQLPPISQIKVPSPSIPLPTECIDCDVSYANDLKNSRAWAFNNSSEGYFTNEYMTLATLFGGYAFGRAVGTYGFSSDMDRYLAVGEFGFALQWGFLQGLLASDCDPNMYGVMYDELVKRMKAAEEKAKKRAIDPLAPCGSGGGMGGGGGRGGGSSGGSSGPC